MLRRRRLGFTCLILLAFLFIILSVSPKVSADDSPVVIDNVLDSPDTQVVLSTAGLPGGNIGIVYASENDLIPYYKVFSPTGAVVFEKNLYDDLGMRQDASVRELNVIGLAGGRSAISWAGTPSGCGGTYQFMIVGETGNVVKVPTDINTEYSSKLCYHQAIELSNGNIVFVWEHSSKEYKYRVYDSDGKPVTDNPESVQNEGTRQNNFQFSAVSNHRLAANDQGQFLIAYSNNNDYYIGAMYDSDGSRRETTDGYHHFYLHPTTSNIYMNGAIGLDNGKFGILYDTTMQIIDHQGDELQTISTGGVFPFLYGIKSGGFVLADFHSDNTVSVKRYDSNGTMLEDWRNLGVIDTPDSFYSTYQLIDRLFFTGYDSGLFGYYNATDNKLVLYSIGPSKVNAETPTITLQPQDKTVNVGDSATLSVEATVNDGGTLTYQWYSNSTNSTTGGTLIDGATSASYTVPTGTMGTTYYYVVVTNTNNAVDGNKTASTTSSVAGVTVEAHAAAPVITAQPAGQTVSVGATVTLSVYASVDDGGTLSYQWYSNTISDTASGTPIAGANSATYEVPTAAAGTTYYYVVVTNTNNAVNGTKTASTTSSVAKVIVSEDAAAPTITVQPQDKTVDVGESVTLSVEASVSDDGVLSYQWYSNSTSSTTGGTPIAGATSESYEVPTDVAGIIYYYVVVTNTNNAVNGNKTASTTSGIAAVTVQAHAAAPSITAQPQDKTVSVGDSATLSVGATVSDGGTLSYQWYSNSTSSTTGGTPIAGANSATYEVPTAAVGTTYYYVVVTNTNNAVNGNKTASTTSNVAEVTVQAHAAAPVITTQPAGQTVNVGATVTLSVYASVSDGGTLSYQWYSNSTSSTTGGTLIDGANSAAYEVPTAAVGTTYYYVVVTNTNNAVNGNKTASTTSGIAAVTVLDPTLTHAVAPIISTQPAGQTVNAGATVTLSVYASVSDGGTLSYQWYSNTTPDTASGTPIDGATGPTYTVPAVTVGTTYYYVVVTNTNNAVNGNKTASTTSSIAEVVGKPADPGGSDDSDDSDDSGGPGSPASNGNSPENGLPLIVNGERYDSIAIGETTQDGDRTKMTATIDKEKLEAQLEAKGDNPVVIVPAQTVNADQVVTLLTAETVKLLENKGAVLEIQTINGNYRLPAELIEVERMAGQFGENVDLSQIIINVEVSRSDEFKVRLAETAAASGDFAVIVPPADFTLTATYGGRTIEIDRFEAYILREIPLPAGVDASRITTAVVIEDDGSVRHVPTYVTQRDGVYYAVVNSLTNSTYTLVWHPKEFADVANHWSRDAVNDMASRMVVKGVSDTLFNPDRSITRAEFAAIMVRALGLSDKGISAPFSDINPRDWFVGAVAKANEYGLIQGYGDGTFRPNDTITRQEAIAILHRAMKWTGLTGNAADIEKTLSRFADAEEVADWAKTSVATAVELGLVQGSHEGLNPAGELTRAEAAAIVQRLLKQAGLID